MLKTPLGRFETAHGFIRDWMVCGFFPNGVQQDSEPDLFEAKTSRHWRKDCLRPIGGESAIRDLPDACGLADVEWLPLRTPKAYPKLFLDRYRLSEPDLDAAWPEPWDHCWYALALVRCDKAQDAELRLCGHDGCRVWVNGQFLFEEHSWHKLAYDLHVLPVRLRRGKNSILLKLDRHGLLARLTAPDGKKLDGKAWSLTPREPRDRPQGTFQQLVRYAETCTVQNPCNPKSLQDYRRWRRKALDHYRRCIGPMPRTPKRPKAECMEEVELEGYTRRRFLLQREAGSVTPVYVLTPRKDRFNGRTVICPHGHGQDETYVAGVVEPEHPYGNWAGAYTGNYAELLAREGFLTATWAERALSIERRDAPWRNGDPCNLAAMCAMSMGMTLPGLHLSDLHAVTDFVVRLEKADPARVGLTGLSGGATMTYLATAYDERFKAAAPFCGILSYMEYARGENGCGQQVVPDLFPTLDVGELLCLAAPRPMLLAQGRKDVLFNIFTVERFYRQARKVYRLFDASDVLKTHFFDGAHQVDVDAAVEFFREYL